MRRPINAVVISHERDATQRLFAAVKGFIETSKNRPTTSIDSKSEIRFPRRGSSYFIGTAGQKAFGRGDTIARAHLSEAAFYTDLGRILNGIAEAAEFGQIDIETTANGRGEFYDMWQAAKSGRSSYTPIFIPWFIDSEYSIEKLTEEERKGLSGGVQEMFAIPDDQFELQADEKELIKQVQAEWGIGITIGQIKWRRAKIWDKGQMFFQEYPEDDVSCFLQTGRSVFTMITCDPTKMIPLENLDAWKRSEDDKEKLMKRRLYGGIDCAEGTPSGDAHCFAVIDVDTQTGKGVVIFELWSHEPIDVFCHRVMRICEKFDIHLGVEKNGVGVAHIQKLRELGVILDEWETTGASRPVMITELEEAYRKGQLIETIREAENEARDMEYGENNRAEHKKGRHDDRIFARAIAWQMRNRTTAGLEFV
jgi:hypothetical protein